MIMIMQGQIQGSSKGSVASLDKLQKILFKLL